MPKVLTPMAPIYAINKPYYDVADYGNLSSTGMPDGVASNSAMIIAAANAANTAGGGVVFLGEGTWRAKSLPLYSNVFYVGAGRGATIIKLEDGANTDLFSAQTNLINLSAAFGAGIVGTLGNFGFANIILDGNRANQTAGTSWPLRAYGYNPTFDNVEIINGYTGGMLLDWNGATTLTSNYEGHSHNVIIHDCNGENVALGGPSASHWANFHSYNAGSNCLHLAPNATKVKFANLHCYGPGNPGALLLVESGGCQFDNAQCEGANAANIVILANGTKFRGETFGEGAGISTVSGIQIGFRSGDTAFPGQILSGNILPSECIIDALIYSCAGANGSLYLRFDGGANLIRVITDNAAGGVYETGAISNSTQVQIVPYGLTADGTTALSGTFQIGYHSNAALHMLDSTNGNDKYVFGTAGQPNFYMLDNAFVGIWGGQYSTPRVQLNATGVGDIVAYGQVKVGNSSSMYSGSGAPAAGTGANGDFYFRTDTPGTANQRIYVRSAGAWVGIV